MSIKEAMKNVKLKGWIENGRVSIPDLVQITGNVVKEEVVAFDKSSGVAIVDTADMRLRVADTVKGGVVTGVGLTILTAGLARTLLSPSGIVGMGMIVGGGITTAFFGGKTVKDYWAIHRKLKK